MREVFEDPNITIRAYFGTAAGKSTETGEARAAAGWIADIAQQVKPRTWAVYEKLGRGHIVPALGHLKVRPLHRAHVRAFVGALFEKGLADRDPAVHARPTRALSRGRARA